MCCRLLQRTCKSALLTKNQSSIQKITDGRFEISDQNCIELVEKTHATENEKKICCPV